MGYEADGDEYNREMFFHESHVWHTYVIKLYGVCHVGERYFACGYAGNGTLDAFLKCDDNSDKKWQKLYQVALGLQCMHQLSIAHKDLKCANILIETDGDAKITDAKQMGAAQRSCCSISVASDVYAFGMYILEAASGEPPWGALIDTAVRYHVRKGKLSLRYLEILLDSERALIEMMCASSASDRIKISSVIGKLEEFSNHEATETNMAHGLDPVGIAR